MSCCRKHFTAQQSTSSSTQKLRVLANLYCQMRSGTDVQHGDWLKVTIDGKVYRLIYKGSTPIASGCSIQNFPWHLCTLLSKDLKTRLLPFREMDNPENARQFDAKRISDFEITAPFAYP